MATIDIDCECGNPDCHNVVYLRKGNVYFGNDGQSGWFHIDITDMEGKNIELMITPSEAKYITSWMRREFGPFSKLKSKFQYWRHRIHIWRS